MSLKPSKIQTSDFQAASFAVAPKFPALRFASREEFRDYLAGDQNLLDARAAYEQSLATSHSSLVQDGTCAPCLRPARFTSGAEGGMRLPDGRCVPNWREAMQCDCRDALNNRQRALLHFVQAAGVLPWTRLLLVGEPSTLDLRLSGMAGMAARLREGGSMQETEGFHLAIAQNDLPHTASPRPRLEAISRHLLAGGRFIFTAPFHPEVSQRTNVEAAHLFSWDLLTLLREAGFSDAAAYLYWSEELGYLGPMNFIFRAVK